ncbi:putative acyl-CoA dehydrogenase [Cupriavidus basilensis OR16]|uniref:Putative acyl-CoA dehydrogenase n=1 Tax=Cupriavidus basilensis OR16 TaxID=1127483 RepID=H1S1D0_9BURK|nr:acyl-CoA dehydrogenase family protein [Cupriavidus basilensis]EHP43743.1 putative acyl-CoA dehydrogenase [Cupriavidus basilensis OR16]
MDFSLNAAQQALQARTRAFIAEHIMPMERDPRQTAHGPTEALRTELVAKARAAGLLTPHASKEAGGLGLSHADKAIVFEEAGYSPLGPVALNIHAPDEGNIHLMEIVATPAQKKRWLQPLIDGHTRSCFCMTEPSPGAGADPSMLQTVALQDGDDYLINTCFTGGHAVVRFDNLRVPATDVLGKVGEGFRYAQLRLAPARLTHCMRWLGAARRAHDVAADYARQRRAFGRSLVEHEGVGFMLADNEMELHIARLTVWHCAWVLDQGEKGRHESSQAKVICSEALWRIVDRSVQVLGGSGVTDETIVARIFRDMRAFRIYDGPSEVHRWSMANRIARG